MFRNPLAPAPQALHDPVMVCVGFPRPGQLPYQFSWLFVFSLSYLYFLFVCLACLTSNVFAVLKTAFLQWFCFWAFVLILRPCFQSICCCLTVKLHIVTGGVITSSVPPYKLVPSLTDQDWSWAQSALGIISLRPEAISCK